MKKMFKNISILLVLTLLIQIVLPLSSLASSNDELEIIKQETKVTDEDIQLGLLIISDNSSFFLENADLSELESYGIEDQNIALLKYYYNMGNTTQSFNFPQLETRAEIAIQPRYGSLIRVLVKGAIKKKQGPRIEKQIGKEVDDKVVKQMQDEAENLVGKYGYTKFVGPEGVGANGIRQGEHIFEIYGSKNQIIMQGHVQLNQSRNLTTWHWHKINGIPDWHYGQTQIKHNSLPNWGSN